jgi:mono/diheme cytochrome c family protein
LTYLAESVTVRGDQNDYNRGGMIAFVFSMAFCLLFFVYVSFVHKGIDLKEVADVQPPAAGQAVAQDAAPSAPKKMADIASVKEPWNPTPELIEHGHAVFLQNCAMCHGQQGMGDGPAGASLNPPPRNFVEGKWKRGGDSLTLMDTVAHGIQGSSMASFAHIPVNERWAVIAFIRSITKNKIADDPAKLKAQGPSVK